MPRAKKRLVPRLSGGATVKYARLISGVRQRLIAFFWDGGELRVTADHALLVREHMSCSWRVVEACKVKPRDEVLVYSCGEVLTPSSTPVLNVEEREELEDVIEIEMACPADTVLVCSSPGRPYVVVFGKQPDLRNFDVLLMLLSRQPKELDEALGTSQSLRTCSLAFPRCKGCHCISSTSDKMEANSCISFFRRMCLIFSQP